MNRDKLVTVYETRVKHNIMITDMIRHLPMNALIKFKISYVMSGQDLGLNDNKWHVVPGDALGITVKFNTESVLINVLASERTYPLVKWYKREERFSELKTALGFKWILEWGQVLNPKDELPLHVGAQLKTKLFEQYLKRS
jgi:hypothetical protein